MSSTEAKPLKVSAIEGLKFQPIRSEKALFLAPDWLKYETHPWKFRTLLIYKIKLLVVVRPYEIYIFN